MRTIPIAFPRIPESARERRASLTNRRASFTRGIGRNAALASRSRARAVLAILVLALVCAGARAQVPPPDSVLGFRVGEDRKLADWQQVLDYFQKVAAAAPAQVKFDEIGKSTLGKPFVVLTVSSADN